MGERGDYAGTERGVTDQSEPARARLWSNGLMDRWECRSYVELYTNNRPEQKRWRQVNRDNLSLEIRTRVSWRLMPFLCMMFSHGADEPVRIEPSRRTDNERVGHGAMKVPNQGGLSAMALHQMPNRP